MEGSQDVAVTTASPSMVSSEQPATQDVPPDVLGEFPGIYLASNRARRIRVSVQ